jgi:hypothetical protein
VCWEDGRSRAGAAGVGADEQHTLENWAKRRSTAQDLALRARIVLASAEGHNNIAVAARLGVSRNTVTRWRARFPASRLDGLGDEPRPGCRGRSPMPTWRRWWCAPWKRCPRGPRTGPNGSWASGWGSRRPACTDLAGVRAAALAHGRLQDPPDPLLIDKIGDVIGLYLAPQANAAVFAVDEKPPGSRSPPCAHHDPLCAMQTREWTSTRTIQNGGCVRGWLAVGGMGQLRGSGSGDGRVGGLHAGDFGAFLSRVFGVRL